MVSTGRWRCTWLASSVHTHLSDHPIFSLALLFIPLPAHVVSFPFADTIPTPCSEIPSVHGPLGRSIRSACTFADEDGFGC